MKYIATYIAIVIACLFLAIGLEKLIEKMPYEFLELYPLIMLLSFTIYCTVSLAVFLYYFFNPNAGHQFWRKQSVWCGATLFGAFLTCNVIMYTGIRYLLVFIPEKWAELVATFLAVAASAFLVYVFYEFIKMRSEY